MSEPMHADSVPAPTRKRAIQTAISLDVEHDDLLTTLAASVSEGNRSKAVRYLLDVHAGREILKAHEREHQYDAPPSYRVVQWAKPKLNNELIAYLAGIVRAGALPDTAMELAGITPSQRSTWLKRGKHDRANGVSSLEADFVAALARAEAECEVEDIQRLRELGYTNYRALTWRLERQYPERYAETKRVNRNVTTQVFPVFDWDKLTALETKTLIELMRKASPDDDDPSLSRTMRPALELLPADVIDGEIVEETEAPALDAYEVEAEAPDLDDEKPQH